MYRVIVLAYPSIKFAYKLLIAQVCVYVIGWQSWYNYCCTIFTLLMSSLFFSINEEIKKEQKCCSVWVCWFCMKDAPHSPPHCLFLFWCTALSLGRVSCRLNSFSNCIWLQLFFFFPSFHLRSASLSLSYCTLYKGYNLHCTILCIVPILVHCSYLSPGRVCVYHQLPINVLSRRET